MSPQRIAAMGLCCTPASLALLGGQARPVTFLAVLCADILIAMLVANEIAALESSPSGRRFPRDLLAWWVGTGMLLLATALSFPIPPRLGTPTPGRRWVLVVATFLAATSVSVVLAPARRRTSA